MSDKALYFPYINVPETAWLTRLLLYWDKIGSIVPSEYINAPERLTPYMRDLIAAELVEQIFPGAYVYTVPNFTESFLSYVEKRLHFARGQFTRSYKPDPPVRLHIEKLGDVADALVRLGLARPAGYPWYDAEPWVARSFMAYLATVLGRLEQVNADPVTNDLISFRLLGGGHVTRAHHAARARARSIILKGILPGPTGGVAVRDLAEFKAEHGHFLKNLRRHVEKKCIEIANITESSAREEYAQIVARELSDEVEGLAEAMRRRWPRIVFSALMPVLGGGMSLLGGGGIATVASAGLSLKSAAYGAFDLARTQRELFASPLAYAALARGRFPVTDPT